MRVLHVISSGGMYGAEAVILNLSGELNRGAQNASFVGVFSHLGQPDPALHGAALRAGVDSNLIRCKGQIDLHVASEIRDLVRKSGADVVHTHGYKADIYASGALRGDRPALVSTCHTWYDNDLAVRVYGALDRWVLKGFDEVVAVSPEVRDRLSGAGVRPERIHLIRNGIGLTPFGRSAERRAARRAQGGPVRVGLVGRLSVEKGVDLFLGGVAAIAQAHPDARFVVAGDGPDRASLEGLLRELGLEGRAELAGQQGDMPAFYESLDVLVSASRQEGLPMALLEGMASGLPLVATTAGAVPEIVVDGVTGLLVPPGSVQELADAMDRMLADPAMRERFGAAGRERIIAEFSAERMAREYLAVYERALTRRASFRSAGVEKRA